jgi:hypothetical protein
MPQSILKLVGAIATTMLVEKVTDVSMCDALKLNATYSGRVQLASNGTSEGAGASPHFVVVNPSNDSLDVHVTELKNEPDTSYTVEFSKKQLENMLQKGELVVEKKSYLKSQFKRLSAEEKKIHQLLSSNRSIAPRVVSGEPSSRDGKKKTGGSSE